MWHLHQLLAGSKSALASLVNNFKRQHLPQKQPKCEESQSKSAAELLKECELPLKFISKKKCYVYDHPRVERVYLQICSYTPLTPRGSM